MKLRHALLLALIPLTVLPGCRRRPVATEPAPADTVGTYLPPTGADADSIRMAEERDRLENERLERERLEREGARAREVLTEIVFFEYDSYEITPDAAELLRLKAAVLNANPNVRIRIEGHADQRGSTEYNLALGQRRAEAVRVFLADYGVDVSRFATTSYGKERPLMEGDDEYAFSRNRRAEFAVTGGSVTTVPRELQ
jgi:peptidoglycan-associated lipoprotein